MNLLGNANTKLMKDKIFHWSIPAYEAADGSRTCPGAKDCIRGCYARQGFHGMSWVKNAKERRLAASLQEDFVSAIINEIVARKVKVLRLHDAGDFYSLKYLWDWLEIIERCPDVTFYAYTKMIPMFKNRLLPPNFIVIYSFGGKWDDQISEDDDHHSRVFRSHAELLLSGYTDATQSDMVALQNRKVGLVYHGGKYLNWGIGGKP